MQSAKKQRHNAHAQRKTSNIRKEAAKFKDGLGYTRTKSYLLTV